MVAVTMPPPAQASGLTYMRALTILLVVIFGSPFLLWYLHTYHGLSADASGKIGGSLSLLSFFVLLALPWMKLSGQAHLDSSQRLDKMVVSWLFLCLAPRFVYELPWLFALPQLREGVLNNSPYTAIWSSYLLHGDSRYLYGDDLVYVLEVLAVGVGIFELYALYKFFVQGRRFTNLQMTFILSGMVVEGFMPLVYIGVELMGGMKHTSPDPVTIFFQFFVLNLIWVGMPLLTLIWGFKRVIRQDLQLRY